MKKIKNKKKEKENWIFRELIIPFLQEEEEKEKEKKNEYKGSMNKITIDRNQIYINSKINKNDLNKITINNKKDSNEINVLNFNDQNKNNISFKDNAWIEEFENAFSEYSDFSSNISQESNKETINSIKFNDENNNKDKIQIINDDINNNPYEGNIKHNLTYEMENKKNINNKDNEMNSQNKLENNETKEHLSFNIESLVNKDIIEKILLSNDNIIIFNGMKFQTNNRINYYNIKNKKNKIIYKCIFNRHLEKERIANKHNCFCPATIEYYFEKTYKKYLFKKDHSIDCYNINLKKNININKAVSGYDR